MAAVRTFLALGGRDLTYLAVLAPALWFWLRDRPARRAVTAYWRRLRPQEPRWLTALRVPRHLWRFARTLADRLVQAADPAALRCVGEGEAHLAAAAAAVRAGRGLIVLSAHLGSFDLGARWLAAALPADAPAIRLVMLDDEDPRVRAQLDRTLGGRPWSIIDLRDPVTAALAIASALGRGEICCMLGDRTAGDADGTRAATLLGGGVRLPVGPFVAAAVSGAPVLVAFCCRDGWRTWRCQAVDLWRVELGPRSGREERLQAWIQRWAGTIEDQIRRRPWDWNNYYDFWA
ncbi:MAG: hypothetical protein RLZZ127_3013 [Planctomycetota bacterium]